MDMSNEQLEEALEHDDARRQTGDNGGTDTRIEQTTIATEQLVDALDIKNAYLSKSVSLAYVDFARGCCALVNTAVAPPVDLSGQPRGLTVDIKKAGQVLDLAERAVQIARELDVLGDKNILRVQEPPKTEQ